MKKLFDDNLPHLSPVWSRIFTIESDRAEGSYIFAKDGRKFLDFTSGIGVTNTGHCHPKVVEAIREQAGMFLHGQINIVVHKPIMQLIEELQTIVPSGIDGFFFSNSGAEAVEGAIKLARNASGKHAVIVFSGSFHGRTAGAMALTTSKTVYKQGPQVLSSGVYVAPYPYAYRLGMSEEQTEQFALEAVDDLLASQIAPSDVAAMLIEPVLGEGGYVPPPADFLKGLREICSKHGILLILDEVQSGIGRTGKWFAFEHYGVEPDIITVAKGIASGMPLSGVFSNLDLMEKWPEGSHGGTYGGNAVACAAAVATIQAIREEKMLENVTQRGLQLQTGLRKLQEEFPQMGDVRGLGLMIGSEFEVEGKFKKAKPLVKEIIHAAEKGGLLLLSCGTYDSTVRWIPPLNVTEDQISNALSIFADSLKSATQ